MGANGWVGLFVTLSVEAFPAVAKVRFVEIWETELTGFLGVTAVPVATAGVPAHPVNVFAVLPVHVTSIPSMRSTGGRKYAGTLATVRVMLLPAAVAALRLTVVRPGDLAIGG